MTSRWRMVALVVACAALGACSAPVRDDAHDASADSLIGPAPAPRAANSSPPAVATPAAAETAPAAPPTVWERIAAGEIPGDCEVESRVTRRIARYVSTPGFTALMTRSARYLPLVLDTLDEAQVPPVFALLPVVETGYLNVSARGRGPAGLWQFMPVTARAQGLAITADYDARLDAHAATHAAAKLLAGLGTRFDGDWALTTMAFNAGEFRVRGALRKQRQRATAPGAPHAGDAPPTSTGAVPPTAPNDVAKIPPAARDALALSPITHDHYAKLIALACIVAEPARHGVTLPVLDASTAWVALQAPFALDRDLALALSTLPRRTFAQLNPALRAERVPAGRAWLVPASAQVTAKELLARFDAKSAREWTARSPAARGRADAAGAAVDADLIAALNAHAAPGGNGEFVPARSPIAARGAARVSRAVAASGEVAGHWRVRAGESLWRIARRLGVRVEELIEWNGLSARATLRPGQLLRVTPASP